MEQTEIHGEQVAGRSAQVRKALKHLSTGLTGTTLDLAELLYEAQENNYAPKWGFQSLPTFAERELGIKPRKAQYLARIVRIYRAVGLTRSVCEGIAISKLREITRLEPEGTYWNADTKQSEPLDSHIVRLITDADTLTLKQIEQDVARLMGHVGPNRRITRSYNTNEATYENVIKPAFELIRRRLGSAARDSGGNAVEYADGVCIEMACAEILADPNFQEPMELPEEVPGLVAERGVPVEEIPMGSSGPETRFCEPLAPAFRHGESSNIYQRRHCEETKSQKQQRVRESDQQKEPNSAPA